MSLFELSDVSLRIGDSQILSHVSIGMQRGEIVTIVGPNGSGKSTLLRMLIGSLAPREGRITKAPGLRIGYVPQRLALDPTLPKVSADRAESVARALERSGVSRDRITVLAKSDAAPIYYESMPSGEAGNRRAEIYFTN